MGKGRIIFIFIVSIISVVLILFSLNYKGYDKVGRVNEYVVYYQEEADQDQSLYDGYILRLGFYEVAVEEAIENQEISQEYIEMLIVLINDYEEGLDD
jgi:hypothetical protein